MGIRLWHVLLGASVLLAVSVTAFLRVFREEPEEDFSYVQRMTDTRPASEVAGSFWTRHLDCTYRDPPADRTVRMKAFDCASAERNLAVLASGKSYFTPRGSVDDEPPYCLVRVKRRPDASSLQVANERKYIYCGHW